MQSVWRAPDERRVLQLVLATIWLFDGVLQLQPYMFTTHFGAAMLAPSAPGNPGFIAHPITWVASTVAHHSVVTNACFAAVQILLGLAVAWRPTVKVGLAASVGWALAVWWLGEGFGGVFAGVASTVSGAPGAVVIYAVVAVLLWPTERGPAKALTTAARAVGERGAALIWVATWGTLAFFTVIGANRSAQGLHDVIASEAMGEPAWLGALDHHVANVVSHRGLGVSIVLAVVLAAIAGGVFLPGRWSPWVTVAACVVALAIWIIGENFGGVFSGSGTDPNSGPLLILLACIYWPRRREPEPAPALQRHRVLEAV